MPEPTSPDLSFSGLLDSLPDNNSGSITPEKVRSIAALSRPLRATVGTGVVDAASLRGIFDGKLLNTNTNIQIARLAKLQSVAGATAYAHYSGTSADSSAYLQTLQSASANLGVQYVNPGGQPRTFDYEWELLLKASTRTFWAITFYYLPSGTSWPTDPQPVTTGSPPVTNISTASASWSSIKIHHSEAMYGDEAKVIGSSTVWQAHSAGKKSITLNPGDAIVPVLEYWGEEDNGSYVLTEQDTSVVKWSMAVTGTGVAPSTWDDDADYWATVNNRDKVVFDLTDVAAVGPDTIAKLPITIATGTADLPSSPVKGQVVYRTDTNELLTYTSTVMGWTKPWNTPWGLVGWSRGGTTAGALSALPVASNGHSLSGSTFPALSTSWTGTTTQQAVLFNSNLTWYRNRRLQIDITIQTGWSNSNPREAQAVFYWNGSTGGDANSYSSVRGSAVQVNTINGKVQNTITTVASTGNTGSLATIDTLFRLVLTVTNGGGTPDSGNNSVEFVNVVVTDVGPSINFA